MANIIGISAHFHDSACCLLKDQQLVAAAEEERFSRQKHDSAIPKAAFRYCLEAGHLSIDDIDCVAYYEKPEQKLGRQIAMVMSGLSCDESVLARLDARRPERDLRDVIGYEGTIEYFGHHLSHMASAFYYSGFDESAIVTVDGVGEWETTTYGRGCDNSLEIMDTVEYPHSLGLLYSAITAYLGFDVNEGEYKVMGLAPYGEPKYLNKMWSLLHLLSEGQYELDMRYFNFNSLDRMYSEDLIQLFGEPPRNSRGEILTFHKDVARSLQSAIESALLEKVAYLHKRTGSPRLCMAGGVALNCVANGRILREGPFKQMFVQPAAGDAGGCLGAAALAAQNIENTAKRFDRLDHLYYGPSFGRREVARLLNSAGLEAHDYFGREADLLSMLADRLAAGKVIGWFQGRMEFGPRALGARSILADPRHPGMRDRINALVKEREAFRPFAPAVLTHRCREHFDLDHPSRFMLETCKVVSSLPLPAITHVDGSARVQTVDATSDHRFARLLEEFERRTGCPILLNTSFNMKGEPIVCSPADALLCFIRSQIDTLVIEDFVVDRQALHPASELLRGELQTPTKRLPGHDTYTFL